MRVILSRKGFDSGSGGVPSPLLPDGRLISLPIPSETGPVRYGDISVNGEPLGPIVDALTGGRVKPTHPAHLDPDLAPGAIPRLPGWLPAFGQVDSAQSHLAGQGVTIGDLFMFFGWFREVEAAAGSWRYRASAPDRHILFGWLSIGEVIAVGADARPLLRRYPWLSSHPHVHFHGTSNNTIYAAAERLAVPGRTNGDLPGAGIFRTVSHDLVLTKAGQPRRSLWHLPSWLDPRDRRTSLSYHGNQDRWNRAGKGIDLATVGRGQEFVVDCADYPEAAPWAREIIGRNAAHARSPCAAVEGRLRP